MTIRYRSSSQPLNSEETAMEVRLVEVSVALSLLKF